MLAARWQRVCIMACVLHMHIQPQTEPHEPYAQPDWLKLTALQVYQHKGPLLYLFVVTTPVLHSVIGSLVPVLLQKSRHTLCRGL